MPDSTAQIHLDPLVRSEALYLLGGIGIGFVVCGQDGATVRRPGFHLVDRGQVVVLTVLTAELEAALDAGLPLTYLAESVDEASLAGWYVTVTGTAESVDPHERVHYQRVLPGFTPSPGSRVIRLRPDLVGGHRFQRLTAEP